MTYAAHVAAVDKHAAIGNHLAEQSALDRLNAHVATITARTPVSRAEALVLAETIAGELHRLFGDEVAVDGPIHRGLASLQLWLLAEA